MADNHWRTRGCSTRDCSCRRDPPEAPTWSCTVGTRELNQLLVMASHGQRAVAAAVLLVETFPGLVLPDLHAQSDVAAGAAALADLLNALRCLLEHGHVLEPVRRWALGVPPEVLPQPPGRRIA